MVNKVAIITGASQGIGAGLVTAYRKLGYSVVGTSRSIGDSHDPEVLTVRGGEAENAVSAAIKEHLHESPCLAQGARAQDRGYGHRDGSHVHSLLLSLSLVQSDSARVRDR